MTKRRICTLGLICLLSFAGRGTSLHAQEPYLVQDLYQATATHGSAPSGGVAMGGFVYFRASTLEHGEELWRSDGMPGGVTELVKDVRPGVEGSAIRSLTVVGSTLFFRANDGLNGEELWRSDGTAAGTVLMDIRPGESGSAPSDLAVLNGALYFSAFHPDSGRELWTYDAGEEEPLLVVDLNPGTGSGVAADQTFFEPLIVVMGGKLYMGGSDGMLGMELWTSNGTAPGTQLVKDIRTGASGSISFDRLVAGNSRIYLTADDGVNGREIWTSNGTEAGTVLCKDIRPGSFTSSPDELATLGDKLIFSARAGDTVNKLWVSDGTEAGTQQLMDLFPSNRNTLPAGFPRVGNHVLFTTGDAIIWKTDGTEAGTVMLDGPAITRIRNFTVLDSTRAIFSAAATTFDQELWLCNLATNSYARVKDVRPGSSAGLDLTSRHYFSNGSEVFFAGNDNSNKATSGPFGELWKTDGTEAGTVFVHEINNSPTSSEPVFFTPLGNRVLLSLDRTSLLGRTDGSENSIEPITDLGTGRIQSMIPVGNSVFICFANTKSSAMKYELWKSNGTEGGTVRVSSDIGDYTFASDHPRPGLFTVAGDKLYFVTTRADTGRELWVSNGTAAGTKMVKDIRPGTGGLNSSLPESLAAMGNTLYFRANDGINGIELWKSNGTAAGTVMVKDIYDGLDNANSTPDQLTVVGNTLFFVASDSFQNDRELWKSDGTEAGTVLVKNIRPGTTSSAPQFLTAVGDLLYFRANDGVHGAELWKSDGTEAGTTLVKDIVTGGESSVPQSFVAVGDRLYFVADDGVHGLELWKSDGTPESTVLFADTRPGSTLGVGPQEMTAVGTSLFFRADNGVQGDELWRADGTPEGTVSFDINPGPAGSGPTQFGFTSTRLFFSATTSATGREPFAIAVSAIVPTVDSRIPTQKITSKIGRVKEGSYDLAGTANDDVGVASVLVSLNGAAPVPAVLGTPGSSGAVPFSLDNIALENGANEITVISYDAKGNASKTTTLAITFLSNRPAIAGNYQGLLLNDDAVTPDNDNTGIITLKVTAAGVFTGKVGIGKYNLPVRGIIDNAGHARFRIKGVKVTAAFPSEFALTKKVNRTLTTEYGRLFFEVDAGLLEGSLRKMDSDDLLAMLNGARAHFNGRALKVPDQYLLNRGQYTAHFPADVSQPGLTDDDYPQGVGVATVSIKKNGRVAARGTLADGTKFSSRAALSETLGWPLFARLYKKGGAFAGWVQMDDSQPDTDLLGDELVWLRPENLSAKHYPEGWPSGVALSVLGAKYQRPAGASVFPGLAADDLTTDGNAIVEFSDGLLSAPVSHSLNIDSGNRVKNVPDSSDFQLKISVPSGLLSGFFIHTDESKTKWQGIIHQKGAHSGGIGFFLSTVPKNSSTPGESGAVSVSPEPE